MSTDAPKELRAVRIQLDQRSTWRWHDSHVYREQARAKARKMIATCGDVGVKEAHVFTSGGRLLERVTWRSAS